ncbi:MAG TPA: hypothetical protein PLV68_08735, partial [Ilumatobacteraceae bacterium]|nr:hypothetical protein [Ilumatobacteraceae bacterium]
GEPLTAPIEAPAVATIDSVGLVTSGGVAHWQLAIERDPACCRSVLDASPPVAAPDGKSVHYWTEIGPPRYPEADYSESTLTAFADLHADGTGTWYSVPTGWHIAASDLGTTILWRLDDSDDIQLALFSPLSRAPMNREAWMLQTLGVDASCPEQCSAWGVLADGALVRFDRATAVVTALGPPSWTLDISATVGTNGDAWLVAIGPADVGYFTVPSRVNPGEADDLVAIALTGNEAGHEVGRRANVFGTDSRLVPTVEGIVSVGCCGLPSIRPPADAELVMAWVDATGAVTTDQGARLSMEFVTGGVRVVRLDGTAQREWTIATPINLAYRGVPPMVALDDGGVLIFLEDSFGMAGNEPARLLHLSTDGDVADVMYQPVGRPFLLTPSGSAVVNLGNQYALISPEDAALHAELSNTLADGHPSDERVFAALTGRQFTDLAAIGDAAFTVLKPSFPEDIIAMGVVKRVHIFATGPIGVVVTVPQPDDSVVAMVWFVRAEPVGTGYRVIDVRVADRCRTGNLRAPDELCI